MTQARLDVLERINKLKHDWRELGPLDTAIEKENIVYVYNIANKQFGKIKSFDTCVNTAYDAMLAGGCIFGLAADLKDFANQIKAKTRPTAASD